MMQCFFPKSNTVHVSVTLLDDVEKIFKIPVNQKAAASLCDIAKSIPVTFVEYFGLKYLDRFQKMHWVDPEKSLYRQLKKSQVEKPTNPNEKSAFHYQIYFEVRYYPRDPTSINDEYFRYQVFLQIRKDMMTNKLTIKDERIVSILCALILQSDFGDYDRDRFAPNYIRQTIPSHLLVPTMEDQIKGEHIKLRGVEPAEAEYQFLEKIRWLENYGTIIFPVKDNAFRNCYLGLNPQGFALRYYKEPHLKYDIFWPRISTIKRTGRLFVIKEKAEKSIAHRFETGEKCLCKTLYKLSLEHFAFFKLKKDDKPLVKEPTKRTCGKNSPKEVGYSSDTSDNNQFSDDTSSSYPDSINTIQSAKMSKAFKKHVVPIRNCASDVEESALSNKNRKVIVCKMLTETEDDTNGDSEDFGRHARRPMKLTPSVSHDRIPADYIYENRMNNIRVTDQIRQKRLTKKLSTSTGNERKFYGHRELEPLFRSNNAVVEASLDTKYQIPFKSIRTRESGYQVTRSRTEDGIEIKARMRRRLPSTDLTLQMPQLIGQSCYDSNDRGVSVATHVENVVDLRPKESPSSPVKRLLPSSPEMYGTPPIPKHRLPPKQHAGQDAQNRPQSLLTDYTKEPVFRNVPPLVPQRTGHNPQLSNQIVEVADRAKITYKPHTNYTRRSTQETGI